MTSMTPFRFGLGGFARDEDASVSVEAVLILPLLLWAFVASYTFFDVYRDKNLSLKANYAVSDLLSRETTPIDMNYLNGAAKLYKYLTRSPGSGWMRVTSVYCDQDCDLNSRRLKTHWSKATGSLPTYTDQSLRDILGPTIPWLAAGDQLIVVETGIEYKTPFSRTFSGIGDQTLVDVVMTRPRFSQLCWGTLPPC